MEALELELATRMADAVFAIAKPRTETVEFFNRLDAALREQETWKNETETEVDARLGTF